MPRLIFALILGLAAAMAPAVEPTPPQYIKWAEVEVRSGPSKNFDATMILRKNAKVYVKKPVDAQGFIEIMPPQGSISWIMKAVVTKIGEPLNGKQAFTVTGTATDSPVPVIAGGTNMADGPLRNAKHLDVPRGTQGTIRGAAMKPTWDDREWYPIDPIIGESRYIPAKALQEPTKDDIAASTRVTNGTMTSMPARDIASLKRRAEEADKAGRIEEAIDLYQQLGIEASKSPDSELAAICATRVYELRRRRTTPIGALTSRNNDGKGPTDPPIPNGNAGGGFTPPRLGGPGTPAAPANNLRSTGVGYLRRASFMIDNKPTYELLGRNKLVAWYVTPEPGLNMDPYVDRWVELHGIPEVRADVRGADYMRIGRLYLVK